MLSYIWLGLILVSLGFAVATGRAELLTGAALEGAASAVKLCLGLIGPICLWCGVLKTFEKAGISGRLVKGLSPILSRLLPRIKRDGEALKAVGENVTANLLGLGNAATPAGLRAAKLLGERGETDMLCRFVLLNTASIQLIPTTVASVRAALGSNSPFDILPAVWVTSAGALAVGLTLAVFAERLWHARKTAGRVRSRV